MVVGQERHGDVVVLRIRGDDGEGWESLDGQIAQVIAAGPARLVIDYSELYATNASPVASALSALFKLRAAGGRMAVVRGRPDVWKQFEGMDFVQEMNLHDSLEDALKSLRD